jgi:hypothetical protein
MLFQANKEVTRVPSASANPPKKTAQRPIMFPSPPYSSMKENQTRNGLRLLLVLDQVHTVENLLDQLNNLVGN